MMIYSDGYAKIVFFETRGKSNYEYQFVPDIVMTVRMIMTLLYGTDGKSRRGEIPMIQINILLLSAFP